MRNGSPLAAASSDRWKTDNRTCLEKLHLRGPSFTKDTLATRVNEMFFSTHEHTATMKFNENNLKRKTEFV